MNITHGEVFIIDIVVHIFFLRNVLLVSYAL